MWDQTNRPRRLGWAVAVIASVAAAAFRWEFLGVLGLLAAFITFYPAVTVAVLYGGFSSGVLATLVSAAFVDYFWMGQTGRFSIASTSDLVGLIIFIFNGAFISYVADAVFRSRARAAKAEEQIRISAEREKMTEELRKSEERLRISKQAAMLGIFDYDVVSGDIHWDGRTRELWGVGPDEPITYDVFISGIHPDDRDATRKAVDSALDPGVNGLYFAEYRVVALSDSTERWVRATGQVFFDADRPVRLVGTVQDITRRKRADEALRESEREQRRQKEFLECLIANAGSCIAVVEGPELRYTLVNPAMQAISPGIPMIGKTYTEVFPGAAAVLTATMIRRVLDTGEPWLVDEYRAPIPGKPDAMWQGSVARLPVAQGEAPMALIVAWEITDRIRAENIIRAQSFVFETINLIFQKSFSCDTEEELRATCLQLLVTLTQSQLGFIARIGPDGLPHGETTETANKGWDVCETFDKTGRLLSTADFNPDGLCGRIFLDGESLLTNDPGSYFDSIDMPEDLPSLTAFLGVPFKKDGKTVGVIGLANRNGGYAPEHLQAVEATIPAMVQVFDRKRAEQLLRESKATIEAALASTTDAVFISDTEGRFVDFNDGFVKYHRFLSRDECPTHISKCADCLEVWLPDGSPAPLDMWAVPKALNGEVCVNTRYTLRRRDTGQTWTGSYSFGPIRDRSGVITGAIVVARDITEQRRMEEEIRELVQRLSYHVDNSPLAVIEWGPDMRLIRWSGEAERMFGWRAEEVIGKRMEDFRWIYKEDESHVAEVSYELQSGADPQRFSANRNYRKDGSVIHCEWYNSSLLDDSGNLRSILSLVLDVTERNRMEDDLRRSREELELRVEERTAELKMYMAKLEESNRALQDFAFIAAHDLQEPLRKVNSFGNMLEQKFADSLGEQGQDYLKRMLGANERMDLLLKALLEYSRLSTRAEPFVGVDLAQIISDVLCDLELKIERTGGKVTVSEFPVIKADPQQMRQLFQNLIGNALKFHKDGEKPVVDVRCSALDSGKLRIEVADNGIGFDERYVEKIFAPFQRLHGRSSRFEGTGMGLSICKKIVERHGGSITARTAPDEGSVFIVDIPGLTADGT